MGAIIKNIPPKGFLARRFIETATLYLKGVRIINNDLEITNCIDFRISLKAVADQIIDKDRVNRIPFIGNDKKYTIPSIAKILNVKNYERIKATDIISGLANSLTNIPSQICISDDLLREVSTLNLLKANYYEYGRAFLTRPSKRYIIIDKLPIITQIIALLGALLSHVGVLEEKDKEIYYYLLPPEEIHSSIITSEYEIALKILRGFYDAPRSLFAIKLSAEILLELKDQAKDQVFGDLVSVMIRRLGETMRKRGGQRGSRSTVISIEPVSTESFIELLRSLKGARRERVARSLSKLMSISIEALRRGERNKDNKLKSLGNVITNSAEHLLIFARTCSLEALHMAISLLTRLAEHIKDPEKRSQRDIIMEFLGDISIDPSNWLRSLARDLTYLSDICLLERVLE